MTFLSQRNRALEIISFCLVVVGALGAHFTPATGYELSIYDATPTGIWVVLGLALLLSLILVVYKNGVLGYLAGLLAVLTWTSMRLIRGHHVSGADPLVHLGIVRYIAANKELYDLFYPSMHLLSTGIANITGLSLRRSLLVTTPLFILLFVVFCTLLVRRFSEKFRWNTQAGFLTALLLLPVNWLGVQLQPHPSSYALLLIPFVLYLIVLFCRSGNIAIFVTLSVVSVFFLFLHPFIVLLLTSVLAAMAVANLTMTKLSSNQRIIADQNWRFYGYTVVLLGVAITFKLLLTETFQSALVATVRGFGALFTQQSTTSTRATSLTAIGVDPVLLVAKWMGVSVVTGIVAGLVTLKNLYRWVTGRSPPTQLVLMLAIAVLALVPPFVGFLIADFLLYFRILGLIMLLVSLVFALGVAQLFEDRPQIIRIDSTHVFIVIFAILLIFSMPLTHPSPYITQSSGQRTEAQLSSVDVLSTYADDPDVITVRSHYPRLSWAVQGRSPRFVRNLAPDHFNDQELPAAYNHSHYVLVTERDYQIDVRLYSGLRFTADDFAYLDREDRLHRVVDVGEARIYRMPP